ncbi:hypothetical protein OI25_2840 [Paraburkholderia fungorum]|jgi:hypothetical protein|uniref:Uncharacterized protein n=1 Tax=Paraburkholderia fungorum TaxID=134537 RepID=A0AAU8SWR9_9BURK|nr:hypothetical protein OI25_2840 [Paraburkholderia fungorum]
MLLSRLHAGADQIMQRQKNGAPRKGRAVFFCSKQRLP